MTSEHTTDLAVINGQEWAIIKTQTDISALLTENVGTAGIGAQDLDRVHVPSGGGLAWEVPSIDGTDVVKELVGVIVYHRDVRVYWEQGIDEGAGPIPPDCYSDDAVTGHGEPGGECATCPFAQFGSDDRQRGQACKAMKQLFIVTHDAMLPTLVALPPTSVKIARQYLLRLVKFNLPYWAVLTRFTLEKATNAEGVGYAQAVLGVEARLSAEQVVAFRAISKALRPHLGAIKIDESMIDDAARNE